MKQRIVVVIAAVILVAASSKISLAQDGEQRLFVAGGKIRNTVPLVEEMVSALRKEAAYSHIFGAGSPAKDDLVVTPVNLTDSAVPTFLVIGRLGLPGVGKGSTIFWIVRRKESGFEALNNFGGQELEIKDNQTNGYRDLELRSTSIDIGKFITSITYDSRTQVYRESGARMEPVTPVPAANPQKILMLLPGRDVGA
jgi:hypothetical protein